MAIIVKSEFKVIFKVLKQSASELKNQQKQQAISTIKSISGMVQELKILSEKKEAVYKVEQENITRSISELIKQQTLLRDNCLEIQESIDSLNVQIMGQRTKSKQLAVSVELLKVQLVTHKVLLKAHQEKLNDLNDTSAESILLSIVTLGIDRAVKGIAALINDDANKIRSLQDELNAYQRTLKDDKLDLNKTKTILVELQENKNSSEKLVEELKKNATELKVAEGEARKKLVFFTQISLFYGKLLTLLSDVNNKIHSVQDIVEELDDEMPTIIDFDSRGEDLISLRSALERSDKFLDVI